MTSRIIPTDGSEVFRNLARLPRVVREAAIAALVDAGEATLTRSNEMVPLDETTLERSGRVSSDGKGTVAISYDTPYAVVQHEDESLEHINGREAGFLRKAVDERRDTNARYVADKTTDALAGEFR